MADEDWRPVQKIGIAMFDFDPAGDGQIKLNTDDRLKVADEEPSGWMRGENTATKKTGMFPSSYVKLTDPLPPPKPPSRKPSRVVAPEPAQASATPPPAADTKGRAGSVTAKEHGNAEDNLEMQIKQVLKEWIEMLKRLYQQKNIESCHMVKDRMAQIIAWRQAMQDPEMPKTTKDEFRNRILRHIEGGRRLMGLDMMPRTAQGAPADEGNTGFVDLLRLHEETHGQDLKLTEGEVQVDVVENTQQYSHVYLSVQQCIVKVMEPCVYYFSLQKVTAKGDALERISDNYVYFTNKANGVCRSLEDQKSDIDLVDNTRVIFSNVPTAYLSASSQLYLVCRMYRYGKVVFDPKMASMAPSSASKKDDYEPCRRPFGCSVVNLIDILPKMDEQEVYIPPTMPLYSCGKEEEYHSMPYAIARSTDHGYGMVPGAIGIAIGLQLLRGDLNTIVEERDQEFKGIKCAPMLQMEEMKPGLKRHEIFVTMEKCSVLQGGKKTAKNVQVGVQVMNRQGQHNVNCMYVGTTSVKSALASHQSAVEYHNNSPIMDDPFKLIIPASEMKDTHLKFQLAHASSSKKAEPFSFSFLELMKGGTAIADGSHELGTFKMPGKGESAASYLVKNENKALKEQLTIKIKICSTEVTQNQALNDLLNWKNNTHRLDDVLNKFMYVEPSETLKFVSDVLDALFGIAIDANKLPGDKGQAMRLTVFKLLVQLLNTFGDEKAKHHKAFKPLLDQFIKTHLRAAQMIRQNPNSPMGAQFNAFAEVHKMLVTSIDHHLERRTVSKELRETMKGLRYIFQIMINSRIAYSRSRELKSEDNQNFKKETTKVLTSINMIMKETGQMWRATRDITLRSFDRVFADLVIMYYPQELGHICQNFFEAITDATTTTTKLKLNLMKDLIEGTNSKAVTSMFSEPKFLKVAYPTVHKVLLSHLHVDKAANKAARMLGTPGAGGQKDETAELQLMVVNNVLSLLRSFEKKSKTYKDRDVDTQDKPVWGMLKSSPEFQGGILGFLMKVVSKSSSGPVRYTEEMVTKCGAAIVGILHQALPNPDVMEPAQSAAMFKENVLDEMDDLGKQEFLKSLLGACQALHARPPFASSWVVMGMATTRAIYKTMSVLSQMPPFSDGRTTGAAGQMWRSMVGLIAEMIQSPHLQLQTFSQVKQTFLKDRYGDLREWFAKLLLSLWEMLQSYEAKRDLVDVLLKPAMMMSLTKNEEVGKVGRKMYSDLLMAEYAAEGAFKLSENFTIESANEMVEAGGKDQMVKLLDNAVQVVAAKGDASMKEAVEELIKNIQDLVNYLEELNSFDPIPSNEVDRSLAATNLIAYLEKTQRDKLRNTIVHKLANEIHQGVGVSNYTEAGIVLLKSTEATPWSPDREKMVQEAIDNLDRGKDWERCIQASAQMRRGFYEPGYAYEAISKALAKEAEWYDRIVSTERFFASYYRVEYVPGKSTEFGKWGGKCYILRAGAQEDLRSFMDKINRRWPKAKVVLNDKPEPDRDSIMINTVTPQKEIQGLPEGVSSRVVNFLSNDEVNEFMYQISARETKEKVKNEMKDLWTFRNYFKTKDTFPAQVRCAECVEKYTKALCPIESAIMNMNESYDNLYKSVQENTIKPDKCGDTADLSRYLGGMIDAAVNGGPRKYAEAFFTPQYPDVFFDRSAKKYDDSVHSREKHLEMVKELKGLLVKIRGLIPEGLAVHERLMVDSFRPLQDHLVKTFEDSWVKQLVEPIERGESVLEAPDPPSPLVWGMP